ncbi:MAG: hypothetical protein ACLTJ5_14585 [Clostridium sp.]
MNQKKGNPETDSKSEDTDAYLQNSVLKGVDLTLSLTPEEYKKKKKRFAKADGETSQSDVSAACACGASIRRLGCRWKRRCH